MKLGEFELNQIYIGDSRELCQSIPDNSVDLLVTDPPYFLPVNTYVGVRGTQYHRRTIGDTSIMQFYFDTVIAEFASKLKASATAYVFCDGQSYPLIYRAMYPHFKYVRPLIWDKVVSYNGYTWRHQHEIIAWGEGYEAARVPTGDGDIISCRGVLQKDRLHAAEKPVELVSRLIAKHKETRIVLDPYSGSAPVPVACKQLGVDWLAFEIDPKTAEIARQRIQKTPELLPFIYPDSYQGQLFEGMESAAEQAFAPDPKGRAENAVANN